VSPEKPMSETVQTAARGNVLSAICARVNWQKYRDRFEYGFLMTPAIILFTIFVAYPVVGGIYYSMTDWNGIQMNYKFIGLQNYVTFIHDFYVMVPLRNTFVFAFALTIFQNIASLVLAVLLETKLRSKNILRVLIFIPVLLSPLIVGYLWNYLFSDPIRQFGLAMNLQILARNVLGDPRAALMSGVFVNVWRMVGWTMVVYIAALQAIPKELYEAAGMDGAVGWNKFRHITFPLIAPAFTINMVVTMERGFKEFDTIFALTKGGPANASEVISLTIYRESFEYYRAGYGATMGVALFLIIVVITIIQLILLRRKEENVVY
jgi:raffinose/stachyose/melibiose transport system permease protein